QQVRRPPRVRPGREPHRLLQLHRDALKGRATTMKNLGSLVFIASSALLAACSTNTPPEPNPSPTPAQNDAVQLGAGHHAGDVYPVALQPRANLALPVGLATVSQPLPPNGSVTGDDTIPSWVASTDALHIAPKGTTLL